MAEININREELNAQIEKLKSLQTKISSSNISCPVVDGGGSTVQKLEDIGVKYKKMHSNVYELVSQTISFMENISQSYQKSDDKAASNFK